MARLLFTQLPTNDLGLLTRSLPVALGLSQQGHTILFSNPAKAPRRIIADAGFENILPLHPFYEIGFSGSPLGRIRKLIRSGEMRKRYNGTAPFFQQLLKAFPWRHARPTTEVWNADHAFAITGFQNKHFVLSQCIAYEEMMKTAKIDAVVDCWNPIACIAAKHLKIPLITINQADALPSGDGFIWWREKPEQIPSVLPNIRRVLSSLNLPSINQLEECTRGDLSLVVGSPETDPQPSSGQDQFIGPLIWQKPGHTVPGWLTHLPEDKKIIWLYPGNLNYGGRSSIFDSGAMLIACIKALARDDIYVVLSMGHQSKIGFDLPPNFHQHTYVPGLEMAARCHLMIHHGGYGSCQTGLLTGTPQVILPTFTERESNARRIALLKAGEYILPDPGSKKFDAEEVARTVDLVLTDPSYRINALKYSELLKSYGGAEKAVSLIEAFITPLTHSAMR